MEIKTTRERRRFLRVPCDAEAKLIMNDTPTEHGILNISKGGIKLSFTFLEPLKILGKNVCIKFETVGRTLWALGKVVYVQEKRPNRGVGIKFSYFPREHRAPIEKLVQLGTWRSLRISYI